MRAPIHEVADGESDEYDRFCSPEQENTQELCGVGRGNSWKGESVVQVLMIELARGVQGQIIEGQTERGS